MTDIMQWTDGQIDDVTHKFETLIHGPAPTRKIGFITVIFSVEEAARAKLLSNVEKKMIINVMYQLLKALTTEAPINGG